MKKKAFFIILFIISLFSCQSNSSAIFKDMYAGYFEIAEEFYNLKKYDKAAIYYEKCLKDKDSSERRSVQYKLAKTYIQQQKYDKAEHIYRELLEIDGQNMNLKSSIAFCMIKTNRYDEAEKIYLDLIKEDSVENSNYKNLLVLQIIKGDFDKADETLSKYKELFPLDESIQFLEDDLKKAKQKKIENEEEKAIESEKDVL